MKDYSLVYNNKAGYDRLNYATANYNKVSCNNGMYYDDAKVLNDWNFNNWNWDYNYNRNTEKRMVFADDFSQYSVKKTVARNTGRTKKANNKSFLSNFGEAVITVASVAISAAISSLMNIEGALLIFSFIAMSVAVAAFMCWLLFNIY